MSIMQLYIAGSRRSDQRLCQGADWSAGLTQNVQTVRVRGTGLVGSWAGSWVRSLQQPSGGLLCWGRPPHWCTEPRGPCSSALLWRRETSESSCLGIMQVFNWLINCGSGLSWFSLAGRRPSTVACTVHVVVHAWGTCQTVMDAHLPMLGLVLCWPASFFSWVLAEVSLRLNMGSSRVEPL